MIEAILICAQLIGGLEDCTLWSLNEPMERTPENVVAIGVECETIVAGMLQEGFTVTCEEYVEEAE